MTNRWIFACIMVAMVAMYGDKSLDSYFKMQIAIAKIKLSQECKTITIDIKTGSTE